MSRIRVVVADQAEAVFYDMTSLKGRPVEVGRLADPTARRHGPVVRTEAVSGGDYADAADPARGDATLRRELAARFARIVAERLEADRRERAFQQLILVAGAPFRSILRGELSEGSKGCVVYEVPKDLVHSHVDALLDYLPERAHELRSA